MLEDDVLNTVRPSCFPGLEMTDYPGNFRMICGSHSVWQWLLKEIINDPFSANCKGMINIGVCSEDMF
jgi:hypothetical protein